MASAIVTNAAGFRPFQMFQRFQSFQTFKEHALSLPKGSIPPLRSRRQLEMEGLVASEAVHKRHEETMQEGVFSDERPARVLRFAPCKQSRPCTDRRPDGLAARRARRDLDHGIVPYGLYFPGRIVGPHERAIAFHRDAHRRPDRRAVPTIASEQNRFSDR